MKLKLTETILALGASFFISCANGQKGDEQGILKKSPVVCSYTNLNLSKVDHVILKSEDYCLEIPLASGYFDPLTFNDPLRGWNIKTLQLAEALSFPRPTKEEVVVAVVDTGVSVNHPDLEGKIWGNKDEIPDNEIDDDHNGYIDDFNGFDVIKRKGFVYDDDWHGSHVSGIIGAVVNNNIGIAGIADSIKIMSLRAVPNAAAETDADVIEAFLYAAHNGARIINCSFGKAISAEAVGDIISRLSDQVLFVIAAGNGGADGYGDDIDLYPTYPASFKADNIITVAATNGIENLTYFSNFGSKTVGVGAPGAMIRSLTQRGYAYASGTSMAAPHVTGIAALVLSRYPELTPLQLKEVLLNSGDQQKSLHGKTISGRRINALTALEYAEAKYGK